MDNYEYTAEMMKRTVFVVEATHYERHSFWLDYHRWVRWEQESRGVAVTLGKFGGMPVVASLNWAVIGGKTVLFWDGVSLVFHHGMWKDWLANNWDDPKWDGTRPATTNADNFHHCLDAIGVLDFLRKNPEWQAEMKRRLA